MVSMRAHSLTPSCAAASSLQLTNLRSVDIVHMGSVPSVVVTLDEGRFR